MNTYVELIAVIFSFISVVQAIQRNSWTWITGLVGYAGYAYLFGAQHLYADFGLQFLYIVQSLMGLYCWTKMDLKGWSVNWPLLVTSTALGTLVFYWIFSARTDNPQPLLDSAATMISISALYLLSIKVRANWILWCIANLIYVALFYNQHMWMSVALYIVLTFIAVWGWVAWKDE